MKAIFCVPTHPSYFDDEYIQAEIDRAIEDYDRLIGGMISTGNPELKVPREFMLLKKRGKALAVVLDSAGLGDGRPVSPGLKEQGIDQLRVTSCRELQNHIENIKTSWRSTGGNYRHGS